MRIKTVLISGLLVLLLGLVMMAQPALPAQAVLPPGPAAPDPERSGAWVDTVTFSEIADMQTAIDALAAGELEVYAGLASTPALHQQVLSNPALTAFISYGKYLDLTVNPAGPTFNDGRLNPFSDRAIREALNRLIDRGYITQHILGGLGTARFFAISTSFPDYARYHTTVTALEIAYSYDFLAAKAVIDGRMTALGATKVGGLWHYAGSPLNLIFLIRVEDERTEIGNYIANQFESLGFAVDRQYKTSAEASQLWIYGDPTEGEWHLYTGGWITTAVNRDEGGNFQFFYSPASGYGFTGLWQNYEVPEALEAIYASLAQNTFSSMAERDGLYTQALQQSLQWSNRLFLVDVKSFAPRRAEVTLAYDLASSFFGSDLWPYTLRFTDLAGGAIRAATPDALIDPWNPVDGTNWIYESVIQRGTEDRALLVDPNTGLYLPQRIESAALVVQTGLPVTRTLDWVTLSFSDAIAVPADAWVDWDASTQTWIEAGDLFTDTQYANVKSTVTYPADLFTTVSWHDGSPLSPADFVMRMLLPFDVADPDSPVFNPSLQDAMMYFKENFRGYRITSTNPLVIEAYFNHWGFDAENLVWSLWPQYDQGQAPWHTLAVAYRAEAAGDLAFSAAKAGEQLIDWMDFLSYPSLSFLKTELDSAQALGYIPYANTLNAYITPAEAAARYTNLQAWVAAHDHFWLGSGPFYLDSVDHDHQTLTLQRFAAFPDAAGKWDAYLHDPTPAGAEINYQTGAPGSAFNITGTNFPINSTALVYVNDFFVGAVFTGATGDFTLTLATAPEAQDGLYRVTVSVNPKAYTSFTLDSAEPIRPKQGDYAILDVPDEIEAILGLLEIPLIVR